MDVSRRKFIKGGLAAVGTAAATVGSLGCIVRGLFTGEIASDIESAQKEGMQNREIPQELTGGGNPSENTRVTGRLRYVDLERSGELERREQALWALFSPCRLCPRLCGTNRAAGRAGACSVAENFRVASFGPHFGEENPLRGKRGSGTIFFSNCNLLCVFCLNWQIAHRGDGELTNHVELANIMLDLQRRGCHNINLVTPTHLVPHLIKALRIAIVGGLHIPLLYNSSGYESLEVIKLLDGVVDIYLPDFKYQDAALAARFSRGVPDYPRHTAAAIKEMHRQVGVLQQTDGIANSGMIIRHLVMPQNVSGTDAFVRWVVSELGPDTHVNIMSQYAPMFQARKYPPLDRRLTQQEFAQAMRWAHEAGLKNFH